MPKQSLPKLPTTVWSSGGPVRVIRIKDLKNDAGELLDGEWRPEARVIAIEQGLGRNAAWHVLSHEMTHAWLDDNGYTDTATARLERVCEAVACGLVLNMWLK